MKDDFFLHPLYIKLYEIYVDNLKCFEFKQEDLIKFRVPPENFINKMRGIFTVYNEFESSHGIELDKGKFKLHQDVSSVKCSDEIFAKYLHEISKKLEPKHYEKVMEFMLLFRELLNKNGRQILKRKLEIQPELVNIFGQVKDSANDFCQEHGAEIAPEICNEFVMKYLVEKKSKLIRQEAIDLTKTFCEWLFKNSYTKIKIMQETS